MSDNKQGRDNDLALAPNEQAFIMDMTKGQVNTYVGPVKTSLAGTDVAVIFDEDSKSFTKVSLFEATQLHRVAPEGWYITLYNPADGNKTPPPGNPSNTPELQVGHKVHIPGPCSMPLWPGQMAKVVKGHHLQQNQYLLIRVYNEKSARASLDNAVVMTAHDEGGDDNPKKTAKKSSQTSLSDQLGINADELVTGKTFIIKGTDVSFFIPPTGIEVVHDGTDFVRDAVTLERLEYCLLVDQQGAKRYVYGPAVVFPTPTERFRSRTVNKQRSRKFKAIELNPNSGIYVKVTSPYKDGDTEHKVGDELFITGKDTPIYYPREEHSIIKYGDQEIHYGLAIPPGEGIYVLNRMTGETGLERGPQIYLADPRTHVVLRRVLDPKVCELLYPNNADALQHNITLAGLESEEKTSGGILSNTNTRRARSNYTYSTALTADVSAAKGFEGDAVDRNSQYTPPRTVTLDNKYNGAVSIDVWDGYAVQLVSKRGGRRVVTGPTTALLEYDETPHVIQLSTGLPKSTKNRLRTAYLRVKHNHTTDVVTAETSDFCNVKLTLCYRTNFEGDDASKWFSIENYVKYMCDHIRSMIRNTVKSMTIAEFHANATAIVRDLVLGQNTKGKRPGKLFEENNMRIYDVEVLSVTLDDDIQNLLVGQQRDVFTQNLSLAKSKRNLEFTKQMQILERDQANEIAKTMQLKNELERQSIEDKANTSNLELRLNAESDIKRLTDELSLARTRQEAEVAMQELLDKIAEAERNRVHADASQKLITRKEYHALDIDKMRQEAAAAVERVSAVSPDLVAAIQQLGDSKLVGEVTQAISHATALGALGADADSLTAAIASAFSGTKLADKLPTAALHGTNGKTAAKKAPKPARN